MIDRFCRVVCLCLCCLIAGSSTGWAQESHLDAPGEIPKYVRDPIPLYTTALGPFHRPITTTNKEAQAFFDQGFQMMYAFAKPEAVPALADREPQRNTENNLVSVVAPVARATPPDASAVPGAAPSSAPASSLPRATPASTPPQPQQPALQPPATPAAQGDGQ